MCSLQRFGSGKFESALFYAYVCRGTGNSTNSPRHVLALHYCSKEDPFLDSSHLGQGIVPHTFSDGCRAAFQRPTVRWPEGEVDRNIRFTVAGPVDHFGNSEDGEPHQIAFASAKATRAIRGPNAAASNASATTDLASFNARFEYDFPTGSVLNVGRNHDSIAAGDADVLPGWVLNKGAHAPAPLARVARVRFAGL